MAYLASLPGILAALSRLLTAWLRYRLSSSPVETEKERAQASALRMRHRLLLKAVKARRRARNRHLHDGEALETDNES